MNKDAVIAHLQQLIFPDPNGVVIVGGSAMAIDGLRHADDIDLIVSYANWKYLLKTGNFQKSLLYGRTHLESSDGVFDVWRWWFDAQTAQRVHFEEIASSCRSLSHGFLVPTIEQQVIMKQQLGRSKDADDIALLKARP